MGWFDVKCPDCNGRGRHFSPGNMYQSASYRKCYFCDGRGKVAQSKIDQRRNERIANQRQEAQRKSDRQRLEAELARKRAQDENTRRKPGFVSTEIFMACPTCTGAKVLHDVNYSTNTVTTTNCYNCGGVGFVEIYNPNRPPSNQSISWANSILKKGLKICSSCFGFGYLVYQHNGQYKHDKSTRCNGCNGKGAY